MSNLSFIVIPVIAVIMVLALYLAWGKFKGISRVKTEKKTVLGREQPTSDLEDILTKYSGVRDEEEKPVEACIYDSVSRAWDYGTLSPKVVKVIGKEYGDLGGQWLDEGKWRYEINRYFIKDDPEPHYRPVEKLMLPTRTNPPSLLHQFLVQPEIAVAFDVSESKGWLRKYLPILIWTGIIIFIFFMWSQSAR